MFKIFLSAIALFSFVFGEIDFTPVFQQHLQMLQNLDQKNPNFLILFSGTPGMGKSTIARRLEDQFQGIRLSSDEARELLSEHGLHQNLADEYLHWCLHQILAISSNHLIIMDRSIDRTYDFYENFAKENAFQTFLIQLVVDKKIVEQRVLARGIDVENLQAKAEKMWRDYENFNATHRADYVFDNNPSIDHFFSDLALKLHWNIFYYCALEPVGN